ncbi:MAG: hypothetical protein DI535_18980 [Citrobacter freundii]|nr:MAG: hypothetical protein DI535_18980 [Citrobacter freundii]
MSKLIMTILILGLGITQGFCQTGESGTAFAEKVANRMRDSLSLSAIQRDSIYAINVRLMQESQAARTKNLPPEELQTELQLIESTRDRLYKAILGQEKYLLYKPRKLALVFAN